MFGVIAQGFRHAQHMGVETTDETLISATIRRQLGFHQLKSGAFDHPAGSSGGRVGYESPFVLTNSGAALITLNIVF